MLGADARTRHVNFDWMEPARQLRVKVDQDQARQLGISSQALAGVLNAAITGTAVTQVRDDIYLVNVVARAIDSERASFETLSSLQVATPSGRMVPLKQFATIVEEQEFPMVWRRDRVPTLTVRADVDPGVLPDDGGRRAGAEDRRVLEPGCRSRYKVATGGLYEESAISSASVFAVVPLMIVLMLLTMMVMLVSFRRLAMVVAILPLGPDRRGAVAAGVQPAAGLRRHPRRAGADRHDRQERGDPDRLHRGRTCQGPRRARGGAGLGHRAAAADDADRASPPCSA